MKPVLPMRSVASAALAAVVALVAASSASAASNAPLWGPPVAYGNPSSTVATAFLSISCVSDGNCVAVGESANENDTEGQPVLAVESAGTWGPISAVTPPEGAVSLLESVSCTSETSCVAVGRYQNSSTGTDAMVVPITVSGSTATAGQASTLTLPTGGAATSNSAQKAVLDGVSCASTCTAVGSYVEGSKTEPMVAAPGVGGTWNATEVATAPSEAKSNVVLTAISCPSNGACEAVGDYDAASGDLYPWAVQVTGGVAGMGEEVALPGNVERRSAVGITADGLLTAGLTSISCPSAGVCTAAGGYSTAIDPPSVELVAPVAVPIANGTPGTAIELSGATIGTEESYIDGIWCSDATDCVVAGDSVTVAPTTTPTTPTYDGAFGSESGGGWSPLASLTLEGGDEIQLITSMTCASVEHCVASGYRASDLGGSNQTLSTFFADLAPALSLATTSLPAASVGQPYSATLQAAGGTGDHSWSISPGALPAGLSLNASTGVISGTPTVSGQSGFIAIANDAGPPAQTASVGLSITVAPAVPTQTQAAPTQTQAAPTQTPVPTPTVGVAYATTSGRKATVVLTCSGAPCAGSLTIKGVERLKGTKATAVVAKADSKGRASTKMITLAGGDYSLSAGGTQVLTLTLSKAAGRLLAALHGVSGYLDVTPTGATSPAAVAKLKLKFKSTSKAKKQGAAARR